MCKRLQNYNVGIKTLIMRLLLRKESLFKPTRINENA